MKPQTNRKPRKVKPPTPEQLRRREIERLRNAATWQPLSGRELVELQRLEAEALAAKR